MMRKGLNNYQLKIIAMVTMTVDHIGLLLLPRLVILRLIGRLAFPIYGYMIAEGCRHTRSMPRYLGGVAAVAAICQLVYLFAAGSLYQCIMVTFSYSIGLIWLVQNAVRRKTAGAWGLVTAGVLAAFFVTEILPFLLKGTDYGVDYGFLGVLLPVCIYLCKGKAQKLCIAALVLTLFAGSSWIGQWFSLLAIPLLALYNGQRGTPGLKWLFYFYYPVHLAVLQGLSVIVGLL